MINKSLFTAFHVITPIGGTFPWGTGCMGLGLLYSFKISFTNVVFSMDQKKKKPRKNEIQYSWRKSTEHLQHMADGSWCPFFAVVKTGNNQCTYKQLPDFCCNYVACSVTMREWLHKGNQSTWEAVSHWAFQKSVKVQVVIGQSVKVHKRPHQIGMRFTVSKKGFVCTTTDLIIGWRATHFGGGVASSVRTSAMASGPPRQACL